MNKTMPTLFFSIIVPVYNRPQEIDELLNSISQQNFTQQFEVIIVEDGSPNTSEKVIEKYRPKLNIKYFLKQNTGAGLSRNYGMQMANGNYFIIVDSDVLLPENYLKNINQSLTEDYVDYFGAPDAAHYTFTDVQKAINYAMTSLWTTGGLRGGKNNKDFQPRSFNMGLSKRAFELSSGFSGNKIGEDIRLSFLLKQLGFRSRLIPEAYVYHKRRSTFRQFLRQTYAFGHERPLLNKEFKGTFKITYLFPTFFCISLLASLLGLLLKCYLPFLMITFYLVIIALDSSFKNRSVKVGALSVIATLVQFTGYGCGYLRQSIKTIKGLLVANL